MLAYFPLVDARDGLAPPLQANLAQHRLAHGLAHLGDLVVERVEREQALARGRRREQPGEIAVVVPAPHLGRAVTERLSHAGCSLEYWIGRA
jgi:hypothetical protein